MAEVTNEFKFVETSKDSNGLDKIVLREVRGCSAEVYSHFATLLFSPVILFRFLFFCSRIAFPEINSITFNSFRGSVTFFHAMIF